MSEPSPPPPEPEIIPPEHRADGRPDRRWHDQRNDDDNARFWIWTGDDQRTRLYTGRPGPLGLVAIFAVLAILAALGFFVFLGALAIVIPLIGVLVIGAIIAGLLRRL